MEEANKLIGTGKKHLVMGKVVEAVSALQEACGMLAKKYGDTADECGEAFFWCGKALLDLARMENSVLGNALEGVPEEEEEEEKPKDSNVESTENIDEKTRDELRVQVYDAMAEKKNEESQKAEGKQSEKAEKKNEDAQKAEGKQSEKAEKKNEDAQKAEKKNEDAQKAEGKQSEKTEKKGALVKASAGDAQQKAAKEGEEEKKSKVKEDKSAENEDEKENEKQGEESAEEAEDGEEEEEEEEGEEGDDAEMEGDAQEQGEGDGTAEKDSDEEEEVGNLQLAWEMLEVAKVIYKRKESKDDQLMAAQTHLRLGEVSAESGNYSQALEDFQECLKLQVKHLDSDSRLLAETHYQLGLTYSLNLQYRLAVDQLNSSISVIKSRLDKLQQLLDKAEGPEALPSERKEMEELKALLPEIKEKVEDATEGLKMTSAASESVKDALGGGSTSSAFPESALQNGDAPSSSKVNGTSTKRVSSTNGHSSSAAVSDISHLVRKKRKPEESPVKEGAVKKVKQEPPADKVDKASSKTKGKTNRMEVESK
ncbi:histone-binding protein N1/N2-like isoform X1 [Hippoglossus hippoglossus]|uniref:histone-binding protein N1/N2-like isoform X1 n=1 Tax=Hippoglossus hippoglossus TaxID=8267 RepID=UPI00148B7254|nr:histone-binding protein N1/N2-like isoform X1 [Hippoglossus hippoglossus]